MALMFIRRTAPVALDHVECIHLRMFLRNKDSSNFVAVRVSEDKFLLQPRARTHGEFATSS